VALTSEENNGLLWSVRRLSAVSVCCVVQECMHQCKATLHQLREIGNVSVSPFLQYELHS